MEKQTCKSCGAVLDENTVHCSECGLSTMIDENVMKELLKIKTQNASGAKLNLIKKKMA